MTRDPLRFWGSALLAALAFALLAAILFPYGALGVATPPERFRVWLLTLWTAGVLAILFGLSGLLGFAAPLGFREVHEAGGVIPAMELRRRTREAAAAPRSYGNFAWWLVATGTLLVLIYFVAWGVGPQLRITNYELPDYLVVIRNS